MGREEDGTVHITYSLPNESLYETVVLNPDGKLVFTTWLDKQKLGRRYFKKVSVIFIDFVGYLGAMIQMICQFATASKVSSPKMWMNGIEKIRHHELATSRPSRVMLAYPLGK